MTNQEIPANYAELIGEAVTLHDAYEKVGFGLKEWEIIAKTSGGISFPVKAFIELKTAFELAGIDLSAKTQYYEGAEPLYTVTVAWDYQHKRLTFDKLMRPDGSIIALDAEAWGKRRQKEAPIIPELRKPKAAPSFADKLKELEKQAISLVTSVTGGKQKVHAELILKAVWAAQGKDTKTPMPVAHGVTWGKASDKAASIEKLALELLQEGDNSLLALVVMDAMAIQGKISPLKGKKGR